MQTHLFKLAVCDPDGTWESLRDTIGKILGEKYFQIGAHCSKNHGYLTHFWITDLDTPSDEGRRMDEQPLFFGEDLLG